MASTTTTPKPANAKRAALAAKHAVFTVRSQESGATVYTVDNRKGQFAKGKAKWITYCATHNTMAEFAQRAQAAVAMAHPTQWCPKCKAQGAPRTQFGKGLGRGKAASKPASKATAKAKAKPASKARRGKGKATSNAQVAATRNARRRGASKA